jgi:hypothetical protein
VAGTVEVVVATCPGKGRLSLGCRGDVDDVTVKTPGPCSGHVIPCSQRAGVVPLLTGGARGSVGA